MENKKNDEKNIIVVSIRQTRGTEYIIYSSDNDIITLVRIELNPISHLNYFKLIDSENI